MMDESPARFHPKRGRRSRGLRQPERRIKAKQLQYSGIQPTFSGEVDIRISSSCTFIRKESSLTMLTVEINRKPVSLRIYNVPTDIRMLASPELEGYLP
ncbi:unnamed protein product [Protopolystoma xenopodis]|uniref:Uncharacterized protein n=1 Tax=Protopolystoma xenopodis TaxID=117903 RepID=A0A448WDP3_9PLAT|nr:unnamed protein product [Protopolystoma xenopodis]